ncbi:MAG TPA: 4,5-DOPA dioxygenase extradiol [Nevskiaceae bacterium]|nr:4,5-DOPA dioxygenase extradiol [Nevskiaceae bacterium]
MNAPTPAMPAVFFAHGTPMNAIQHNGYTQAWRDIAAAMPRPRAILAISAHWYTHGTWVHASERPRTIHDFGGFPRELFQVQYAAPGSPALARRVRELLAPLPVGLDTEWGYDHGSWSVLVHAYPQADIPVVQLSMDATQPLQHHYDMGRRLAALRDEGVLIAGFGNIVHNLRAIEPGGAPADWAVRFERGVRERIERGEHESLIDYPKLGADARMSVPTPEHYLPLLYVLGAQRGDDRVSFHCDQVDLGSIGMLTVVLAPR